MKWSVLAYRRPFLQGAGVKKVPQTGVLATPLYGSKMVENIFRARFLAALRVLENRTESFFRGVVACQNASRRKKVRKTAQIPVQIPSGTILGVFRPT